MSDAARRSQRNGQNVPNLEFSLAPLATFCDHCVIIIINNNNDNNDNNNNNDNIHDNDNDNDNDNNNNTEMIKPTYWPVVNAIY